MNQNIHLNVSVKENPLPSYKNKTFINRPSFELTDIKIILKTQKVKPKNADHNHSDYQNSGRAAPEKAVSPLETILGKGTEVGNGLVVIRQDQISPEAYQLLTKKD